ncbi:N-acetylglucosaminyl-diphospho-decaprenol L-rhamnosyltransferase [compost metagenome]
MRDVGVVIVTWHSASTIEACLRSIPAGMAVVVVDNGSRDETLDLVSKVRPDATLLPQGENLGFGAACNLGAKALGTRDILLLNPDAALESGTLEALSDHLCASPKVGVVGPAIYDAKDALELSWGSDPSLISEWRRARAHAKGVAEHPASGPVDWVTGGCCLIRREAWDAIGGFDTRFFLYFEDLDLCRRARKAGYHVAYVPETSARHIRGVSARQLGTRTERYYRASQLFYYGKYASRAEQLGLRCYLVLKYAIKAMRAPRHASDYLAILRASLQGA